jgi:regulator of sirC expression with transglutaminase-like and TPR domain
VTNPVRRFAALVDGSAEPPLDEAALLIAAGADPDLDVGRWLGELDRLAEGVSDREGLLTRLFVEYGLRGNADNYYEPDNSLLHRVLERRLGIPISLSVVTIEVGRRAGVVMEGVGMPGHFLVRAADGTLFDPFHGGRMLDEAAVAQRFRTLGGGGQGPDARAAALPTVGTRQILDRMLANLAAIYRNQHSSVDLEWVLRMRLSIPGAARELAVELGESLASRGRFRAGAAEIEDRAGDDDALLAAAGALRARLN